MVDKNSLFGSFKLRYANLYAFSFTVFWTVFLFYS